MLIEDGKGRGYKAGVDEENMFLVNSMERISCADLTGTGRALRVPSTHVSSLICTRSRHSAWSRGCRGLKKAHGA